MLGFGIIGAGTAARYHAEAIALQKDARLIAVASSNLASARRFTADTDLLALTTHDLLHHPDIDIVVICTPHDLHCMNISDAARAGKHVLVEKPIGIDANSADEAVEYCKSRNVLLGVVHPRRFDRTWISIRELVLARTLGRLLWLDASIMFSRPPEYYMSSWRGRRDREGGPHLTQAIHHLDILRWLLDAAEPPRAAIGIVASQSATLLHATETPDSMAAQFRTHFGTFGTVRLSTALPGPQTTRVDLYFEGGAIGVVNDIIVLYPERPANAAFPELRSQTCGWTITGASQVIADMCAAVHGCREPSVNGLDAVRSLRFCLALFGACQVAAETSQPVITN